MDIQYNNELVDNCIDNLQELETTLNRSYKKKGSAVITKVAQVLKKLNLLKEEINNVSGGVEVLGTIPARNLEEWKDNATMSLPNGASLAMANDVEAALDKFKSVY